MSAPRDLAEALERLGNVRDYAKAQREFADMLRSFGTERGRYAALEFDNTAAALERIIGDQP